MIKLKPLIPHDNIIDTILNSSEFKNWFGNSKVVDEYGNPLIVYHGGRVTDDFDSKFIGSHSGQRDLGFSFSTNKKVSELYANFSKGNVGAYFLRIPNIVEYEADYQFAHNAKWKMLGTSFRMWDIQEFHKYGKSLRSYDAKYELHTFPKTDGIVFKNMYEEDGHKYLGDTYIVFDPKNIWKIKY